MTTTLRVLIIEDSEDDAQLALRQLRQGGYDPQWTRVDSQEGLSEALAGQEWDVIICDYSLPHLEAPGALKIVHQSGIDVPFIIVSGKIGEETAVAAMKAGAHDYVMKDRLNRLPLAVERELRDAIQRREHERAKAELFANEKLVRGILENVQDAYIRVDRDGLIHMVSPSAASNYGYGSVEEMIGLPILALYPSEEEGRRLLRELGQHGSVRDYVGQGRKKCGSLFWVSINARFIVDEQGQPAGTECFVRDITERMRTEEALQESVALMRSAGKIALFGGWSVDIATNRCTWSEQVAQIHEMPPGYSPSVEEGINFYAPEWRDRITTVFTACLQEGIPYDELLQIVTSTGKLVWVRTCGDAVRDDSGKILRVQGGFQDVTENTLAEKALRESEVRYRKLFDASPDGIVIIGKDECIHQANIAMARMYGYGSPTDMIGLPVLDCIAPSSRDFAETVLRRRLNGEQVGRVEYELIRRDGTLFFGEVSATILVDNDEAVTGYICVTHDTSERKQAEKELQEAKELFEAVVENVPLMIFLKEAHDLRFVVFNRAGEDLLGYDREVLLGKNNLDLFPPDQAANFMDKDREVLSHGTQLDIPEEAIQTANKGTRLLHTRKVCIRGADGVTNYLLGISEDITDRKQAEESRLKLEEQLRASQKMEAIGILAGGVAHDFNNLLSVILSYTGFVMDSMSETDPRKADLVEVEQASERAVALTRQLLAFSRKQVLQPVPLNLNQIALGMEKMLRRILGEDIMFVQVLAPDLGQTLADPGQLEQVLMNLVVNARDAMPAGGQLTVATSNVEIDEARVAGFVGISPGSFVEIAVTDTGCGMDAQTREHIFEPFFTTKEKGRGTGLGLSTVFGIVKQSGGEIRVESEPGHGTTFRIILPRIASTGETLPLKATPPKRVTGGNETILIVEDEDGLRNVARRVLLEAGYTVLAASGGKEALRMCELNTGMIRLALTDVVMPEMSGKELADQLALTCPGIKVLFMSGYTHDNIVHHGVLDPEVQFLGKPFTAAALRQKVREVLDFP